MSQRMMFLPPCIFIIQVMFRKSPIISGSFAESDLQLKASYGFSPPCILIIRQLTRYFINSNVCIYMSLLYGSFAKETYNFKEPTTPRWGTCKQTQELSSYLYHTLTGPPHNKLICLFCKILSLLQGSFAKETYNFKEPTIPRWGTCKQKQEL